MADRKGVFYAALAVVLWATLGVAFKLSLAELSSYSVTVWVAGLTTLLFLVAALLTDKAKILAKHFAEKPWFFVGTGIIGLCIQQYLYIKGYEMLPASVTVIIFYLYPLMMVALSALMYHEKLPATGLLCLALGFAGVIVVVSDGALSGISLWGVIITLIASLAWALFSVLIKHHKFDPIVGMFYFNLSGFMALLIISPLVGIQIPTTGAFATLFYIALFPTAIAFVAWDLALKSMPTRISANMALLTPFLSLLFIALVLHEKITPRQAAGACIIILSVYLTLRSANRRRR